MANKDALKLAALRRQIMTGAEDIARGDFTDVDDAGLERFLDGVGQPARKRAHKQDAPADGAEPSLGAARPRRR